MTAIWGPLGWMTLHSCSVIYPENPSQTDKKVIGNFIKLLGETITCNNCKHHFNSMFAQYKNRHVDWNASRYKLFTMICRFHNEVNKRINKPVYKSVSDCLNTLINATSQRSQREFREAYINHISNFWSTQRSYGDGLIAYQATQQMRHINETYFNNRSVDYKSLKFNETNMIENTSENTGNLIYDMTKPIANGGFKKVNGRFTLLNR
jgi:hypothetical protein